MVTEHEDIYTDLDTLPIYNFDKCINGDLKHLRINKKPIEEEVLSSVWDDLYNKYCELTHSNEVLTHYRLIGEITWLEKRLVFAPVLLNILIKSKETKEVLKELSKWRLPIRKNKDIKKEIERCLTILNNSKSKLKRKIFEYDSIKNKPEQKQTSLSVQKAKLHRLLNIDVNTRNTSVTEWLAYWEEVKSLSEKK